MPTHQMADAGERLLQDTVPELDRRFDDMEAKLRRGDLWERLSTSTTVNYYVFDYAPQQELHVRERIATFAARLAAHPAGFRLIVVDLYELLIDHLARNGYLDACDRFESDEGLDYLTAAIRNSLKITLPDNEMTRAIAVRLPQPEEERAALFIKGIGRCHPFLQGAEVFNQIFYNLSDTYHRIPKILFYPGTYTERELILFNERTENNYYRAFRIAR